MKRYIGIDIGKKGAICTMVNGADVNVWPIPMIKDQIDYSFLFDMIQNIQTTELTATGSNPTAVFEKLGVIFGSSKATTWSMAHQSGAIEMLCISLGLPYVKVPAKEWQKEMFKGIDEITKPGKTSRDTKAMALVAIKRLFPAMQLTFEGGKKPHDGLIDAVLITEYARRQNL